MNSGDLEYLTVEENKVLSMLLSVALAMAELGLTEMTAQEIEAANLLRNRIQRCAGVALIARR